MKAEKPITGVSVSEPGGIEEEIVDFDTNDQQLLPYKSIQNLLVNGSVHLIWYMWISEHAFLHLFCRLKDMACARQSITREAQLICQRNSRESDSGNNIQDFFN